jgi:hypothetical protein
MADALPAAGVARFLLARRPPGGNMGVRYAGENQVEGRNPFRGAMHKPENPMLFVLILWVIGIILMAIMWFALTLRTG